MQKTVFGALMSCAVLVSACSQPVPDSGAGVGFGDYNRYQATRAERLQGRPAEPQFTNDAAIDEAIEETLDLADMADAEALPVQGARQPDLGGLSSEQDFDAVSASRGIAADAERIAAARQQYQLVTPTELERPNDTGPNIIDYALASRNPIGNKVHRRNPFTAARAIADRRCEGYRTADVAQEEFLAAGGPAKDRLGLDPDGDGYACNWDPAVYQNLVQN